MRAALDLCGPRMLCPGQPTAHARADLTLHRGKGWEGEGAGRGRRWEHRVEALLEREVEVKKTLSPAYIVA